MIDPSLPVFCLTQITKICLLKARKLGEDFIFAFFVGIRENQDRPKPPRRPEQPLSLLTLWAGPFLNCVLKWRTAQTFWFPSQTSDRLTDSSEPHLECLLVCLDGKRTRTRTRSVHPGTIYQTVKVLLFKLSNNKDGPVLIWFWSKMCRVSPEHSPAVAGSVLTGAAAPD